MRRAYGFGRWALQRKPGELQAVKFFADLSRLFSACHIKMTLRRPFTEYLPTFESHEVWRVDTEYYLGLRRSWRYNYLLIEGALEDTWKLEVRLPVVY